MPNFSLWPIQTLIRFAMDLYQKNVALCQEIERLTTMNPNTETPPKETPNA